MINNKWKHGKVHFKLDDVDPVLLSSPGIKPASIILDPEVGPEIVLLVTENKTQLEAFRHRDIANFWMKSGLVNTSYGPVCWLFFYFPDPVTGENVVYENVVNPKDHKHVKIYEQLASQEYWHVVIADTTGEVVNFFEFPNHYGLAKSLDQAKDICSTMEVSDFMLAKTEYENNYSIDELMPLQSPSGGKT